ncbi:MAG TPA: uroporphyrinogen decarboxylase family protein [Candidatus Hydrogenedentes bacterium]|nr:uroporphyrinogen decarboxylase family protein [Candidatus Hydrogenedentota bacterium]HOL76030.1 uroporphyrinogen decarboxylase family protein [Candidatus Hydrogenedentota bacterium]
MTPRERFLATMNYQPVDRAPLRDFGVWPETLERWKEEGYDPNAGRFPIDQWDIYGHWFFPHPPFQKEIVAEDDYTVTYVNHEGILMRERKDQPYSSMPQFLRFPVETREDFRKFYRERLQPDLSNRIGANWQEKLSAYQHRNVPLIIIADRWGGFFGPLRNLMGVEKLCETFCTDPAFVEEMMDGIADFMIAVMEQVLQFTTPDVFGFWEDMAFKNGPLIGADMVRRYMLSRYRRVVDFLRSHGVDFISLDSDGDISTLIPVWLDAGINVLYPFEVQSGMDVVQVRREYGKELRLWGGIDKRVVAIGKEAIDRELGRIAPLVREGGYVPTPDHSFPPDVSYSNYCYFMEQLLKIL